MRNFLTTENPETIEKELKISVDSVAANPIHQAPNRSFSGQIG